MGHSTAPSSALACCPHICGPCRTSNTAALPVWAASSISATIVRSSATAIIPARTGTVPSAKTSKRISGCKHNKVCSCPFRTSSSPSPCPPSYAPWPAASKRRSTTCSFAPLRKLCYNWPRTRASSAPASVSSACSTPGPGSCSIIRTSITSSLAAASLTPAAGAPHVPPSGAPGAARPHLPRQAA